MIVLSCVTTALECCENRDSRRGGIKMSTRRDDKKADWARGHAGPARYARDPSALAVAGLLVMADWQHWQAFSADTAFHAPMLRLRFTRGSVAEA
jgi:hypothetical protein